MERQTIQIQGHQFYFTPRYEEGHELNTNEASQLNQVLAENLRNNFAAKVKEAVEAGSYDQAAFQASFDEYEKTYEFGVRTGGGGGPRDPVMSEALRIAKDKVKELLRKKGVKIANVEAAAITEAARKLLAHAEQGAAIMEIARTRVAEAQAVAADDLSGIIGDLIEKPTAPTAA